MTSETKIALAFGAGAFMLLGGPGAAVSIIGRTALGYGCFKLADMTFASDHDATLRQLEKSDKDDAKQAVIATHTRDRWVLRLAAVAIGVGTWFVPGIGLLATLGAVAAHFVSKWQAQARYSAVLAELDA